MEGAIEQLVESETGVDIDGLFSAGVPEGFPASVPLPDGEVTAAFSATEDDLQTWMLTVSLSRVEAHDDYLTRLAQEGFVDQSEGDMGGVLSVSLYENDIYAVGVMLLQDASELGMTVMVQEREQ